MRKILIALFAAMMMVALAACGSSTEATDEATEAAEAAADTTWAYGAIAVDSEDLGVGTVYYTAAYFDQDGIVNPITTEAYTADEIAGIIANAETGGADYVTDAPADAVIGVKVFDGDTIYWYDAAAASAIVAHADALVLNVDDGSLVAAETGDEVATPLA